MYLLLFPVPTLFGEALAKYALNPVTLTMRSGYYEGPLYALSISFLFITFMFVIVPSSTKCPIIKASIFSKPSSTRAIIVSVSSYNSALAPLMELSSVFKVLAHLY